MTPPAVFIVASFGRSGTVWLTKVLNRNPAVLAQHEGVLLHAYPRAWFQAGMSETEAYLGGLKYMAPWDVALKTYAAVGDLNSFGGFHRIQPWENEFYRAAMRPRQEKVLEGTRVSFLARNPIVVLESKWRLLQPNWSHYAEQSLSYGREMIALNRDALGEFEPAIIETMEARIFFMLCLHLRFIARLSYPAIFRMEELTSSIDATVSACEEITGVPYDAAMIADAHAKKENAQTHASYAPNDAAIWAAWSPTFREMFARLCGDLPARLGYAAVAPADQALPQVIGLDVAEHPRYITRHYPPLLPRREHAFAARLRDAGFAPASIVDVGAAGGGWTRNIAPLFPSAHVSLFEPLADIAPKFRECLDELCAAFPNVKLSTFALGETGGRQLLLVTPQPEQSTSLPAVEGTQYVRGEPVPMLPLDQALRKFQIPPPSLLKIAVNGFELQVLKGARQTLTSVEVLFLETWLRRCHGEGCALLHEVVAWLAREGLFLVEILDEGEHREGWPVSRRAVFMRENNRYFADFGARRFALKEIS